MIIDHIGLSVSNYERSKAFYTKTLAPLGIVLIMEHAGWAGFGRDGKPELWIQESDAPQNPLHIAFSAHDADVVDAFYHVALEAGAKDNGPPGFREIYHPHYYAAFVIDPDGYNIEAVCHTAKR